MAAMNQRPATRRERQAARAAAARRRRLAVWVGAGVIVVVAAAAVIAVLAGDGGDSAPSTPEAQGETLFEAHCATCHGPELTGTFVGPPLLHEIYAPDRLADDDIRAAVANGVTPKNWDFSGMPAFPNLDTDDVEALITYIRSSQRAVGLAGFSSVPPSTDL